MPGGDIVQGGASWVPMSVKWESGMMFLSSEALLTAAVTNGCLQVVILLLTSEDETTLFRDVDGQPHRK